MRSPRIVGVVSGIALLAGILPLPGAAARFADVSSATPYAQAIEELATSGVLHGQGDGTRYAPGDSINRAEFSKIVASVVATPEEMEACRGVDGLTDIAKDVWYRPFVCVLVDRGVISGYPDRTFKGERPINFVEAAKILSLAFEQQITDPWSGEWYDGYASALEESKAIPPSVAGLDASLTRGEMAEMLWRLTQRRTDRPSRAVANMKHPELGIDLSLEEPQRATSCADLSILSRQQQTEYFRKGMGVMEDAMMAPMAAQGEAAPAAGAVQKSLDYSETNVQVRGVDEADVVKTDGAYLYIVRTAEKSRVAIVQAMPGDALEQVGSVDLTNLGIQAQEIYVDDGKLTVIGTAFMEPPVIYEDSVESRKMMMPAYYGGGSRTAVAIFDVTNPQKPKQQRVLKFEGDQLSTRRIDDVLYLVLRSQPQYWWGGPMPLAAADSPVPQVEDTATGRTTAMVPCSDVVILPRIPSPQYLAVAAVPLDDVAGDVRTEVILGSAENVYASTTHLYVAATRYVYDWRPGAAQSTERTHVYRFELGRNGIDLDGQGSVPGHLLNQFAMDEHAGYLRLATTTHPIWNERGQETPATNAIYVLDEALEQAGSVEGIAPGETIYAARFMGKRAYLVTFKTIDPFFVVDLSSPRAPKILGQLKIPGYSNYLHPYDDNHVIGIGKEVDASIDADKVHSDDAVYYTAVQGVKMSLFDVSDVANPTELHKVVIGDRGTETPVTSNHRALLFEKERNLLALPILVTKRPQGTSKSTDGSPVFQGAYVYEVTLKDGFEQMGAVSHYDDEQVYRKAGDYWYDQGADVQRVLRIDDTLYTVSQRGVRSHALPSLREEGRMTFAK